MVDLVGQHAKIQSELDEAIGRVMATGAFVKGPEVAAFAEELAEFTGSKHVIPCGNGTDALQIALMALGIGPGDEVITTGFTFISTVEVVALMGAKPVLVDVHPDTFTIDPEQVRAAITPRTKAIVPVHLFGQMADMDALMDISETSGVPIIEDNAQAIGAAWCGEAHRHGQSVPHPLNGAPLALRHRTACLLMLHSPVDIHIVLPLQGSSEGDAALARSCTQKRGRLRLISPQ